MPDITTNTFFSPSFILAVSIAGLRAVDVQLSDKNSALVIGNAAAYDGSCWIYNYDADYTVADNGGTVIKPTSVAAADPGRWRRVMTTA